MHLPQIPVIRSRGPGEALPAPLIAASQVAAGDLSRDTPWDFLNVPEQKTVRQFLQPPAADSVCSRWFETGLSPAFQHPGWGLPASEASTGSSTGKKDWLPCEAEVREEN